LTLEATFEISVLHIESEETALFTLGSLECSNIRDFFVILPNTRKQRVDVILENFLEA
jgi:hypothetical protein